MGWKAGDVLGGVGGRGILRIENETGETVELRGRPELLGQVADLVGAGEQAVGERLAAIQLGGKVGYYVVWISKALGIQSCDVAIPAPGIRTSVDVQKIAAAIGESVGHDVTVISWHEVEIPPKIELASALPQAANLVT